MSGVREPGHRRVRRQPRWPCSNCPAGVDGGGSLAGWVRRGLTRLPLNLTGSSRASCAGIAASPGYDHALCSCWPRARAGGADPALLCGGRPGILGISAEGRPPAPAEGRRGCSTVGARVHLPATRRWSRLRPSTRRRQSPNGRRAHRAIAEGRPIRARRSRIGGAWHRAQAAVPRPRNLTDSQAEASSASAEPLPRARAAPAWPPGGQPSSSVPRPSLTLEPLPEGAYARAGPPRAGKRPRPGRGSMRPLRLLATGGGRTALMSFQRGPGPDLLAERADRVRLQPRQPGSTAAAQGPRDAFEPLDARLARGDLPAKRSPAPCNAGPLSRHDRRSLRKAAEGRPGRACGAGRPPGGRAQSAAGWPGAADHRGLRGPRRPRRSSGR